MDDIPETEPEQPVVDDVPQQTFRRAIGARRPIAVVGRDRAARR
jgi:hypothetical protein